MYRAATQVLSAPSSERQQARWIPLALFRVALLARAAWNAWLGAHLLALPHASLADTVALLGRFFVVDGAIGCILAATAAAALPGLSLWIFLAVDGVARLGLGVLVLAEPGLSGFPVSAVAYLGFVSVVVLFDGWADIVSTISSRTRLGRAPAHVILIAVGAILVTIAGLLSAGPVEVVEQVLIVMALAQAILLVTAALERQR